MCQAWLYASGRWGMGLLAVHTVFPRRSLPAAAWALAALHVEQSILAFHAAHSTAHRPNQGCEEVFGGFSRRPADDRPNFVLFHLTIPFHALRTTYAFRKTLSTTISTSSVQPKIMCANSLMLR